MRVGAHHGTTPLALIMAMGLGRGGGHRAPAGDARCIRVL